MMVKNKSHRWLIGMLLLFSLSVFHTNAQNSPENHPLELAWSPDGSKVAIGFQSGDIEIRDAETSQLLNTLVGHTYWLTTLDWNPTSNRLVSGSTDNTVKIWTMDVSGQWHYLMDVPDIPIGDFVQAVGWSPDGQHIIMLRLAGNPNLLVWDVGIEDYVFLGNTTSGIQILWGPTLDQILITDYGLNVDIRDATTFERIRLLGPPVGNQPGVLYGEQFVTSAWSSDGSRIVSGSMLPELTVFDANTGEQLMTLTASAYVGEDNWASRVQAIWFSSDNQTFNTLTGDGTYRVWNTATGEMLSSTQVPADLPIYAAAISPDGNTLAYTSGPDGTIIITPLADLGAISTE
jgi:WD40 repeat protein